MFETAAFSAADTAATTAPGDLPIRQPDATDLLLAAAGAGDERAFRRLYDATARRLLAQSMAMLRRRDAAEDALQDGYVRIWMHAGRYDPARGPALPWMARIMRNVVLDRLRRERIIGRYHVSDEGVAEPAVLPEPVADRIDLDRGLAALSPEHRNAVVNIVMLGLSHEESGARTGVPVPTSKARTQRGLLRLRAMYG